MVKWTFVPFTSGLFRTSPAVTKGAQCVLEQDAGRFIQVSRAIWEGQSEWRRAYDADEQVRDMAERAGADMRQFDECVESDRARQRLRTHMLYADNAGARGTPTFLISGFPPIVGAQPLEAFRTFLQGAYNQRSGALN